MEIGSRFKDDGCESHEWVRLVNDRGSSGNEMRGKNRKQSSMSDQQKKVQSKAVIRILIRFFASPSAAVSRMKPLEAVSFFLVALKLKPLLHFSISYWHAFFASESDASPNEWLPHCTHQLKKCGLNFNANFLISIPRKEGCFAFCSGCWCSPSLVIHIEYWVGHEARSAPAKSCLLYTTRYKNSSRVSWALHFIPFSAAKLGTEAHN